MGIKIFTTRAFDQNSEEVERILDRLTQEVNKFMALHPQSTVELHQSVAAAMGTRDMHEITRWTAIVTYSE